MTQNPDNYDPTGLPKLKIWLSLLKEGLPAVDSRQEIIITKN